MNLHYSQTVRAECWAGLGLIPLWIYITLKPIYTCVINTHRLIPLWIYITLKHITSAHPYQIGLIPLWIYITLKLLLWHACQGICLIPLWIYITLKRKTDSVSNLVVLYLYEFTLLSNNDEEAFAKELSYTSMNLHYSQTSNFENPACNWYVNPHLCYTFLYNKYQHISF